ncbi:MAG: dihydropteroate synthase [Pseudomonadota bacterium]
MATAAHHGSYRIMGVVNVTPDSFSDGGRFLSAEAAIAHGLALVREGADILDIGGESTRPGADEVPADEERARVIPVVEALKAKTDAALSIDTRKPEVAADAMAAGASIWNDVSALTYSPDSLRVAADLDCDIVLMHAQGDPRTMQDNPHYGDVVEEVYDFLADRVDACLRAGVDPSRLVVDPGVGFGKKLEHNLALIANLKRFSEIGRPVLLGASRKRFISALDREGPADQRLGGSLAAALAGLQGGAGIFRVHDVAATRQALSVAAAIHNALEKP